MLSERFVPDEAIFCFLPLLTRVSLIFVDQSLGQRVVHETRNHMDAEFMLEDSGLSEQAAEYRTHHADIHVCRLCRELPVRLAESGHVRLNAGNSTGARAAFRKSLRVGHRSRVSLLLAPIVVDDRGFKSRKAFRARRLS
jgi:hypothetical protein